MHATKDRVESDTSTVYSISLYESTITTRDEPWFGELKLALGVIGLPVTVGDQNESTSRCDTTFSILVGKERRSPSEPSNKEYKESKAPMAREAHAEWAWRKGRKFRGEAAELIPFAS
ncbi:hypothetical protein Tco_1274405 [Tanacetum coccineum]